MYNQENYRAGFDEPIVRIDHSVALMASFAVVIGFIPVVDEIQMDSESWSLTRESYL